MGGSYEVDVMTTTLLQSQHRLSQVSRTHRNTLRQMADLVVLTEYTAKVAVGHEDCPGTSPANQRILLAKMGAVT